MSECDRRLIIVPVGEYDLRAAIALDHSLAVDADARRAVHIATDVDAMQSLATAWMANELDYPLHVIDNDGGVARTIGRTVEGELANGFDEVVVMLGRLELRHRRHRILHDRSADAIASVIGRIPGARAELITVAVT